MFVYMKYNNKGMLVDYSVKTGRVMDPKTKSDIQTTGTIRVLSILFDAQVGEYIQLDNNRYRLITKDKSLDGVYNVYSIIREDRSERVM